MIALAYSATPQHCLKVYTISAVSSCFNPPVFAAMGGRVYVAVAYDQLDNLRAGSKHRAWRGRSIGDVRNCSFVSLSKFGGGSDRSHSQKPREEQLKKSKMLPPLLRQGR